jgi:hypothetical protein
MATRELYHRLQHGWASRGANGCCQPGPTHVFCKRLTDVRNTTHGYETSASPHFYLRDTFAKPLPTGPGAQVPPQRTKMVSAARTAEHAADEHKACLYMRVTRSYLTQRRQVMSA